MALLKSERDAKFIKSDKGYLLSFKKANDLTKGEETEKYAFVGKYAFLACVIIAIMAGLAVGYMAWPDSGTSVDTALNAYGWVTFALLILGIIVGLLNIAAKEVTPFLIAAIALLVTKGETFQNPLNMVHLLLGSWAYCIINFIVAFVAPAAIILAIKAIYSLARGK
jgi:F0F1-type ATP synthase assembly protein I